MVNDIGIISGIVFLFVMTGLLLPFINESFNQTGTQYTTQSIEDIAAEGGVEQVNVESTILQQKTGGGSVNANETTTITSRGAFNIIASVLKMFFWTFGALPFWLDAIFSMLRILLALLVARNIWIGGGS